MAAFGGVLTETPLISSSSSSSRTSVELLNVLQALASCTKGRLNYDNDWKPTSESLEELSRPPRLSSDLSSISPSSGISPGEQKGFTLSEDGGENQKDEELEHSDVVAIDSVSFNTETDLEGERALGRNARSDELLEKELLATYDETPFAIFQLEKEKKLEARERLDSRTEKWKEYSKQLEQEKHRYLQEKQNEQVEEFLTSVQALQLDEKKKSEEARLRQKKLEQSHKEYAQRAVRRVKEVEELRLKVVRQEQLLKEQLAQLEASFNKIRETALSIQQIFQGCKYQSSLAPSKSSILREVSDVLKISENTFNDACQNGQVTDANMAFMQEYSNLIQNMFQKTKCLVQEVNAKAAKEEAERQAKAKEEEAKKEKEKTEKDRAERVAREKQNSLASVSAGQSSVVQSKAVLSKELSSCISETAWKEYSRLVSYKNEISKVVVPLNTDKSLKQLKFDLQKAVATPINSISEESILDKIQRLTKFLSGDSVQVGRKQISTAIHPAAQAFCKELLARKLVDQGSQQVSSSVSSAFPIAAVAIGVWSNFPDVGDLILMRFYEECPFLVPFYIPKAAGMSDRDYLVSLGYLCSDGQIEQQDKYLKRMTGIVRLYAAIISSVPPPNGQQSKPHPHGPEKGWTWLARMLNLEPRPDYTATALYEFLAVAGHVLMRQYKKQFGKLLNTLVLDYVPKIERVTAKEQSGPVSRLKIFLEKCIKDQKMPVPEGYLTPQWSQFSRF